MSLLRYKNALIKISILVPIYNVEKYLDKCLSSLINQTFRDIEIICINDGSTDSSLSIIQKYKNIDNRVKVINKENSGYGASMNQGLNMASGEYIAILESDDYAENTMLEDLYNIAKNYDADIVVSDFYKYWTNKKTKKVNSTSKFPLFKCINIKTNPYILRNKTTIWSAIYKRELLNSYNIRFLETPGASYQDTSFRIKTLCLANKVIFTDKAYIYYRQDNANSSVKSKTKVYAVCEEYTELTKFLNENPEIKKYANTEKLINQWAGYVWNLRRIDKQYITNFAKKFQDEFKYFYNAGELNKDFYKKVGKKNLEMLLNENDIFTEVFSCKHKRDRLFTYFKAKTLKYLNKRVI